MEEKKNIASKSDNDEPTKTKKKMNTKEVLGSIVGIGASVGTIAWAIIKEMGKKQKA